MRTLFLDLASHQGLIACVAENDVIACHPIDHRIGDHELIPVIEQALSAVGWTYADLDRIACVTGPGGFTSLRVAVACANALAWGLKISITGMHLSDLYAARMQATSYQLPATSFVWLHSTKKDQLFVRGFGDWAKEFSKAACITIEDFVRVVGAYCNTPLHGGIQWTGELIPEHRAIVDRLGMKEVPLAPLKEILPRFLSNLTYRQDQLQPWYGRGY